MPSFPAYEDESVLVLVLVTLRLLLPASDALSFPFREGVWRVRFGELAIAAEVNEGNRFPPFSEFGERWDGVWDAGRVGLPGKELLSRGDLGGEGVPSPDAASVRRNSTQRREKDCWGW